MNWFDYLTLIISIILGAVMGYYTKNIWVGLFIAYMALEFFWKR